jgi:hypothetical protein
VHARSPSRPRLSLFFFSREGHEPLVTFTWSEPSVTEDSGWSQSSWLKRAVFEAGDGRRDSVPLAWFPRLLRVTPKQRANWRLIGCGIGIHWDDVDEDISVRSLLAS